ncbi:type VII secretion protein EssB [Listeria booriae]|uniref:Type VII secretion protein EssB n=1 Tax=Listeria booriae TaxID=1552123 RepID=A0A842B825_9LIST|nr:type VII secretion protein EssB [Listeria booriae]MBC1560147.1 type VII secretion protein EssB [Listeria booriae]MBC1797985.1 type VII secretion protein EssB [Listeria booriae]MDT0109677.1 type VII secretion protein EssB [Listeria booriae]
MNKVKVEIKKAELNATNDIDLLQLQRKDTHLIPCEIENQGEVVIFTYDLEGLEEFKNIKTQSLVHKYQLLMNVADLNKIYERLSVHLSPDNMYFDYNLHPKVKYRDIQEQHDSEEQFFLEYQALVGYVLQNKNSYDDYVNGGRDLLKKDKQTKPFAEVDNVQSLYEALKVGFLKEQQRNAEQKVFINKKEHRRHKWGFRIFLGLFLVLFLIFGYLAMVIMPRNTAIASGYENYIRNDYVKVIEAMENVPLSTMNLDSKHILAVSYIKSEPLSEEQKKNILAGVSYISDPRVLDFWIELGKNNLESSIDLAKQLGNEQYLLYAYSKERTVVENNTTLTGQEKEEKLKEIDQSMKQISGTE